jgi:hypothetical protein
MTEPDRHDEPRETTVAAVEAWFKEHCMAIPLVRWGDSHTKIAAMFAEHWAKRRINATLDDALNSGDASYKP